MQSILLKKHAAKSKIPQTPKNANCNDKKLAAVFNRVADKSHTENLKIKRFQVGLYSTNHLLL